MRTEMYGASAVLVVALAAWAGSGLVRRDPGTDPRVALGIASALFAMFVAFSAGSHGCDVGGSPAGGVVLLGVTAGLAVAGARARVAPIARVVVTSIAAVALPAWWTSEYHRPGITGNATHPSEPSWHTPITGIRKRHPRSVSPPSHDGAETR